MRRPLDKGSPIDSQRFKGWLANFAGYSTPITNYSIEMWLNQFSPEHKDLGARLLDAVQFIPIDRIRTSFRSQLKALEGWNLNAEKRKGRWFFVPFSRSAGESADEMLHHFRIGAGLSSKKFNDLFIYKSELVMKTPGRDDTVVFIDDFSATGNQICESWKEFFSELLSESPRMILMLVASTTDALKRIRQETELEPVSEILLSEKDNIFDKNCTCFDRAEKETLLNYCMKAFPPKPKGWGDKGLIIVLAHRCPNSSIPVLHSNQKNWLGLFPRN